VTLTLKKAGEVRELIMCEQQRPSERGKKGEKGGFSARHKRREVNSRGPTPIPQCRKKKNSSMSRTPKGIEEKNEGKSNGLRKRRNASNEEHSGTTGRQDLE